MSIRELVSGDELVEHPSHYNAGSIEAIEIIEDWGLNFSEGNALKYLLRSKYKGDQKQDLLKCRWYIQRLLDNCEEGR